MPAPARCTPSGDGRLYTRVRVGRGLRSCCRLVVVGSGHRACLGLLGNGFHRPPSLLISAGEDGNQDHIVAGAGARCLLAAGLCTRFAALALLVQVLVLQIPRHAQLAPYSVALLGWMAARGWADLDWSALGLPRRRRCGTCQPELKPPQHAEASIGKRDSRSFTAFDSVLLAVANDRQ